MGVGVGGGGVGVGSTHVGATDEIMEIASHLYSWIWLSVDETGVQWTSEGRRLTRLPACDGAPHRWLQVAARTPTATLALERREKAFLTVEIGD